jgi:hypothetical protein
VLSSVPDEHRLGVSGSAGTSAVLFHRVCEFVLKKVLLFRVYRRSRRTKVRVLR